MSKPFKWLEPAEKEIEDAILQFLNFQIGCFAFKVDTKANFDPRLGTYRQLSKHVLPGTPDILCCLSVNEIPIFLALEVKTPTGRQSKYQIQFQERLQDRANGFYFLVRSVKETEEVLTRVKTHILDLMAHSVNDLQ